MSVSSPNLGLNENKESIDFCEKNLSENFEIRKHIGNTNIDAFKPKYYSQKIKSKCETKTYSRKKENSMQPPEKLSRRKFSLKSVSGGGI